MQDPNEWQRWLKQAEYDLEAARVLDSNSIYALSCFQAQQAGEKALKAFLYAQGERMVLGHSASDLCKRCARVNPAFQALITDAALLDRFYIPTRYPNGLPGGVPAEAYGAVDAQSALAIALQFVETAKRLLPEMRNDL